MEILGWFIIGCVGILSVGAIIVGLINAYFDLKSKKWKEGINSIFSVFVIAILVLFVCNAGRNLNIIPAPENPKTPIMWILFAVAAVTAIWQAIMIARRIVGNVKSKDYKKALWSLVQELIWIVACENVYAVYFAGLFAA